MAKEYLFLLDRKIRRRDIGNKAASLQRLRELGMRTQQTYVLTGDAYRQYQLDDPTLIEAMIAEIEGKLDLSKTYAVRSSANLEDSFDNSFAGQFKTVLFVQGKDGLLQAIWSIWATTRTSAVSEYLRKLKIPADQLYMAVIIQEMVAPVVSGVAFSRNPISGARETVIEAVEGEGSRLVQAGITPDRWIYRANNCSAQPESSPVGAAVIAEVAQDTRKLARRAKTDLDLEWVFDGHSVYWVQMREITTLRTVSVYSNRLAREMMGGMTKPLIWSVNIPMVNGAWIRILTELIGPNELEPLKLAKMFHYRAYFNMGLLGEVFESLGIPAESLEMMWGIAPKNSAKFEFRPGPRLLHLLPRAARFFWDKWTLVNRLQSKLGALETAYQEIDLAAVASLSPADLVRRIEHLFALNGETAYYNIIIPLSMHIYNAILRGQLKKIGVDPTGLDMQQGTPDFIKFNPAHRLEVLNRLYQTLQPDLQTKISTATYAQVMADERLEAFRGELAGLMQRFGHLCDNGNDFSTVPWRENGDTILQLITGYQPRKEEPGNGKVHLEALRLPFGQGWMFRRLYRRARQFMLYREQISYLYSYGYGLFRPHFLAVGEYFRRQGWIDQPEDIFYLDWPVIRKAVEQGDAGVNLRASVEGHRQAMEKVRGAALPAIIYGDQPPPVESLAVRRLSGTPTSRGYCTGRSKVVNGIEDFGKVTEGDVLVIPYSEVGWTPLFARAAGVIAEAGGMLSHSSIIAREYGIPAVVSVPHAMQLTDGLLVSIDGYKGEIIVHEEEETRVGS